MQIKNKKILIIICFLTLLVFNSNLLADEFNISATEISVDKANDIVIGKGSVEAIDSEGKRIKADKITYKKQKQLLLQQNSREAKKLVFLVCLSQQVLCLFQKRKLFLEKA